MLHVANLKREPNKNILIELELFLKKYIKRATGKILVKKHGGL